MNNKRDDVFQSGAAMASRWKVLILFGCLAFAAAGGLRGQAVSAYISGSVQDEEGEYLAGVEVSAIHVVSNAETKTVTGAGNGAFRLMGLAPGRYQVSFDMPGYQSYVASGIQLSADQSATLRVKLKRIPGYEPPAAPAAAPTQADPRTWKKWQMEIGAGYFPAEPEDLNLFIESDRWRCRERALQYVNDYGFSFNEYYIRSTGGFAGLRGSLPLTVQLRYFLKPMLSLVAGFDWSKQLRDSNYSLSFEFINLHGDENHLPENFSVGSTVSEFRLEASTLFPHLGAQAAIELNPSIRLAGFLHAGWAFAHLHHSSLLRTWDEPLDETATFELAMTGRGSGPAVEAGARIEMNVWRGLGLFVAGFHRLCRIDRVSGESVNTEIVTNLAGSTLKSRTSGSETGRWRISDGPYPHPIVAPETEADPAVPFVLDLSGTGLRAGLFLRF